ncbi:MAG: hypothetical protein FJX59_06770 [Alphaproteobacteria bacterium]|nr:hypothetical protein [Alphaproteobacteria bacterium]
MLFGRTIGWVMVVLATLMASGEGVMALGAASYPGLATSEVVTLLVGQPIEFSLANTPEIFAALGTGILAMPAWLVIGAVGLTLVRACRPRRVRRLRHFKTY